MGFESAIEIQPNVELMQSENLKKYLEQYFDALMALKQCNNAQKDNEVICQFTTAQTQLKQLLGYSLPNHTSSPHDLMEWCIATHNQQAPTRQGQIWAFALQFSQICHPSDAFKNEIENTLNNEQTWANKRAQSFKHRTADYLIARPRLRALMYGLLMVVALGLFVGGALSGTLAAVIPIAIVLGLVCYGSVRLAAIVTQRQEYLSYENKRLPVLRFYAEKFKKPSAEIEMLSNLPNHKRIEMK